MLGSLTRLDDIIRPRRAHRLAAVRVDTVFAFLKVPAVDAQILVKAGRSHMLISPKFLHVRKVVALIILDLAAGLHTGHIGVIAGLGEDLGYRKALGRYEVSTHCAVSSARIVATMMGALSRWPLRTRSAVLWSPLSSNVSETILRAVRTTGSTFRSGKRISAATFHAL